MGAGSHWPSKSTCSRKWVSFSNKWMFLINQLQWLAQVRWWELNSLSFCIVHLFRFMGEDGRETKQWSLDVLNIARGLPQCFALTTLAEGPPTSCEAVQLIMNCSFQIKIWMGELSFKVICIEALWLFIPLQKEVFLGMWPTSKSTHWDLSKNLKIIQFKQGLISNLTLVI
jgi:hypothetical protein